MIPEQDYFLTVHPSDKSGVKMKLKYYELIREFILESLDQEEQFTITDLIDEATSRFGCQLKEETGWHIYFVKLDLEARGLIKNKRCDRRKINYIVRSRRPKPVRPSRRFY